MKEWTRDEWGNIFPNPSNESIGRILVVDLHKAQENDDVKWLLQSKKKILMNASPVCMSRVEQLDVLINKAFKNAVKKQFEKHLHENLDDCVDGKLIVPDRRVLTQSGLTMLGKGFVKVKMWDALRDLV